MLAREKKRKKKSSSEGTRDRRKIKGKGERKKGIMCKLLTGEGGRLSRRRPQGCNLFEGKRGKKGEQGPTGRRKKEASLEKADYFCFSKKPISQFPRGGRESGAAGRRRGSTAPFIQGLGKPKSGPKRRKEGTPAKKTRGAGGKKERKGLFFDRWQGKRKRHPKVKKNQDRFGDKRKGRGPAPVREKTA